MVLDRWRLKSHLVKSVSFERRRRRRRRRRRFTSSFLPLFSRVGEVDSVDIVVVVVAVIYNPDGVAVTDVVLVAVKSFCCRRCRHRLHRRCRHRLHQRCRR